MVTSITATIKTSASHTIKTSPLSSVSAPLTSITSSTSVVVASLVTSITATIKTAASHTTITSPLASISTSLTSITTSISKSSITGNTKGLFVELLFSLPVISHHFTLTSFQGFTADVVKEALLFVIKDFLLFILDFTLFSSFNDLHLYSSFFLSILFWSLSSIFKLCSTELVDNLLEPIISLFKVIVILELQGFLLAHLRSSWLETSSSPSSHHVGSSMTSSTSSH